MTPCARNHPIPGEHVPPCTCTRECPEHEDHCRGCRPTEADLGLLCTRDVQHMEGFLGAEEGLGEPGEEVHGLPWAWEHLQSAYPSLSQAPSSGGRSGTYADPEAERLAAAVSIRDDIHGTLAEWVQTLTEQAGLAGPNLTITLAAANPDDVRTYVQGVQVRRYADWLLRNIEPLLSGAGVTASELDVAAMLVPGEGRIDPSGETPEQHLAELRARQVVAVWDELADLMTRAHALAPWRPAPTKLDGALCRCGASELHDHGDEIVCWACRRSLTREEYRVATVVFARRFADDPRAQREQQRGQLAETDSEEPVPASYGGRP